MAIGRPKKTLNLYVYDATGNFLQMQHRGSDPLHSGWTRRYTYNETSRIEPGKQSNRLSSTEVGNGDASPPRYLPARCPRQHDAHAAHWWRIARAEHALGLQGAVTAD